MWKFKCQMYANRVKTNALLLLQMTSFTFKNNPMSTVDGWQQ